MQIHPEPQCKTKETQVENACRRTCRDVTFQRALKMWNLVVSDLRIWKWDLLGQLTLTVESSRSAGV